MKKILVIDDDVDMCSLLHRYLTKNGYDVATVYSGRAAFQLITESVPDLVLCDFRLEDMDGAEILEKIKQEHNTIPVIIMTGYSDVRIAVNIMKLGGFDYVTKPLLPEEILLTIRRALKDEGESISSKTQFIAEKTAPKYRKVKAVASRYIFGNSPMMQQVLQQIKLVAPTNFSVIIYGESGSGKESIAQEIHNNSERSNKPFIPIDCGSLTRELAASELFGHEKGAFTGAVNQKVGSFELANGGTVFLDEIVNLSYDVQVALLRVVQERKVKRVGGTKDLDLDVRIIVASNERLLEATRKGKFREDLYHRFNEFSIELPPLRYRIEDIEVYAQYFLDKANAELGKSIRGISTDVLQVFKKYSWPGNLRELNNIIRRAALLSQGITIEMAALPFEIIHHDKLSFDQSDSITSTSPSPQLRTTASFDSRNLLNDTGMKYVSIDAEYYLIMEALKKCNYNKSKAAKLLDIDRKTLYNKMKRYREFNSDL